MKTVNLNAVTLEKNGVPIEMMGVTNKEKDWDVILDVILDNAVSYIDFNVDNDYKEIYLEVEAEIPSGNSGGNVSLYIVNVGGATKAITTIAGVTGTTKRYTRCHSYFNGLIWDDDYTTSSSNIFYAGGYHNRSFTNVDRSIVKGDTLRFTHLNGYTFGIGTKIKIYAK